MRSAAPLLAALQIQYPHAAMPSIMRLAAAEYWFLCKVDEWEARLQDSGGEYE